MDITSLQEIQHNDLVRKRLAKLLAKRCFRNSQLEHFHSGRFPSSKAGDQSDVKVVSPFGEIAWDTLSRFSDEEMKALMIEVVDRCYDFLSELSDGAGDELIEKLKLTDEVPDWYDPHAWHEGESGAVPLAK
jgi:hypothetical protein